MRNQFGVQTWSGALTIASFIVISITGILMFFHINIGWIKFAHELISWVFVVAAFCHALVHWKLLVAYFRNRFALALMLPVLIVGGSSLVSTTKGPSGHPMAQIISRLEQASLESVSQLIQRDPSDVRGKLKELGIMVESVDQTIAEIAERNGKKPIDLVFLLFSNRETHNKK